MNTIGSRIRKIREEKGITQESMAMELDITQSNYGRLEKDDGRLTVPKLTKIAEILQINISYLFNERATNIIHKHSGDYDQATIENLYQSDKDHIQSLKEEIVFLRSQLAKSI